MKYDATSVRDYISQLPEETASDLRKLRALIRKTVPTATELLKYGHPHYDLQGPLFALAAQKHYLALYVAETDAVKQAKPGLGKLSIGKSCIRFKTLRDLNLEVVERILKDAVQLRRKSRAGHTTS